MKEKVVFSLHAWKLFRQYNISCHGASSAPFWKPSATEIPEFIYLYLKIPHTFCDTGTTGEGNARPWGYFRFGFREGKGTQGLLTLFL